ncbi:MAG: hypothetical protein VYA69_02035 [Gemmatimonadota bacterium]|nr:hypothetical protein [Gemmatimonadota bacterium]
MNSHTGPKNYRLLTGLWLITVVITGCGSIQTRNEKKLEGTIVADLLKTLGESVETATATEEEESFVLNHFRNLWHYMQVSARTTITFKRKYYSGWGKEAETILADIELPQFGLIQITVIDNDGSDSPGVDEGNIKFTREVELPEKGTAAGEFYPLGGAYGNVSVPPSYNMKFPSPSQGGEYFVPTGGLLDYTKRHIKSEDLIRALQKLMADLYDIGRKEVPRTP